MPNSALIASPTTIGLTLQVYVPPEAAQAAHAYYATLFGRPAEFVPHDDFFEWSPILGQECWLQLAARSPAPPLANRVRFRVADLSAAVRFLDQQGIVHSPPTQLPGVVAFLDFADPWENRLGYYQDLAPSGQQREHPGTSATDSTQFTAFERP